jgi:hypothetical protein
MKKSTTHGASASRKLVTVSLFLVSTLHAPLLANSFEPLPGPYEGNVGGFGMDNSNRLYVAGDGGGVFQSSDASGTNWSAFGKNASLPDTVLQSLGVDPSTVPATLYAGSQIGTLSGNAALYRSVDGGNTWTWFNHGLPNSSPYSFAFKSTTGDMFAALFGGAGLYRLAHGSTNWTACGTGLTNAQATFVLVNPANGDVYFFNYGDGKAYRSANNGLSFSSAAVVSGNNQVFTMAMDSSVTPPYLYAGVGNIFTGAGCDLQTAGGLYRSSDSGATWQQIGATALPAFPSGIGGLATDASGRLYVGIANGETGEGGLYISNDHGQTFSEDPSPILANVGPSKIFVANPSTIYLGADGVYRGTSINNGQSWTWQHLTSANGLLLTQTPSSISIDSDGSLYVGTSSGGVSVSHDFGNTWMHINGSGPTRLIPRSVQTMLVEPHTHYLYVMVRFCVADALWRSTDEGNTWSPVAGYSTSYNGQGLNAAIHPVNGIYNIIGGCRWGGPMGPWVSTDNGATARQATIPAGTPGQWIGNIGVNPVTGDIYAGCELTATGVLKSSDNGLTFQETDTSNGLMGNNWSVGFSYDGTVVFEGSEGSAVGGPKFTLDGGQHWNLLFGSSIGIQQYCAVHCWATDASGYVYAGESYLSSASTGQLLRGTTTNHGTNWNWSPYTNGLPVYIGVSALAVNNVDGNLYVGINGGRGLYRSTSPVQTPNPPAATNSISLALTSDATPHQFDLSYTGAGSYPLQYASNLSTPVWLPVSNVTWTATGNTNKAAITANSPALFFRLAK